MRTINIIKAQFISLYLTIATVFGFWALYELVTHFMNVDANVDVTKWLNLNFTNWFGVLLVNLPMSLTIGSWMLFAKTARTSAKLPLQYSFAVIGFFLTMIPVFGGPIEIGLSHIGAIIGFVTFLLYIYWYSNLGRSKSHVLALGESMPVFDAVDGNGRSVSTADYAGKPALYMFFRGNWCPLCVAQIKEVVADYKRLADAGIEVFLVSPQPETETKKLAEKFGVAFHFLTDRNGEAAKRLGIFSPMGLPSGLQVLGYDSDTVLPTVIGVDVLGNIIFLDETDNYRMRPEPETFFAAFGI